MRNIRYIVTLGLALALSACWNNDDNDRSVQPDAGAPVETPTSYLGYVQKMIAATNDAEEPWNVEGIAVEQDESREAVEIN